MQQVDIAEAKVQIENLLQSAISGEEIIITQNQQPILKLTTFLQPANLQPAKRRQRGSAKGQIWISSDFNEPLEDFREYME
jgi:antitoxin (DNA-binding transcriptional repressor) of toxin-antitoxin stability system